MRAHYIISFVVGFVVAMCLSWMELFSQPQSCQGQASEPRAAAYEPKLNCFCPLPERPEVKNCTQHEPLSIVMAEVKNCTQHEPLSIVMIGTMWYSKDEFRTYNCSCGHQCTWHTTEDVNDNVVKEAHAIVFPDRMHTPIKHFAWQKSVYFSIESPEWGGFENASSVFDLVMTYRRDSNVSTTYAPAVDPRPMLFSNSKKDTPYLASFIANNCQGKRLEILQELQNYTGGRIASLSKCGNSADREELMPECAKEDGPANKQCMMSKFLFYLAFENSQYHDYVTEKLFWTLQANTVAVYFGAPNYRDFEPGVHSVIFVEDFASIRQLADYLLFLEGRPELYNEYHHWRSQPLKPAFEQMMVNQKPIWCNLCDKLHQAY
eukprot:TRINITY_DN1036_c0_g1_i1.p1 TRINITY_DN1036_c0_g1~~TRINITY_DN1036_c0_g1_i1.p1  ORF type:complete len:377 (-),score=51.81 TRINITY_DN1036_c0_g1_i1:347-1477(-)